MASSSSAVDACIISTDPTTDRDDVSTMPTRGQHCILRCLVHRWSSDVLKSPRAGPQQESDTERRSGLWNGATRSADLPCHTITSHGTSAAQAPTATISRSRSLSPRTLARSAVSAISRYGQTRRWCLRNHHPHSACPSVVRCCCQHQWVRLGNSRTRGISAFCDWYQRSILAVLALVPSCIQWYSTNRRLPSGRTLCNLSFNSDMHSPWNSVDIVSVRVHTKAGQLAKLPLRGHLAPRRGGPGPPRA